MRLLPAAAIAVLMIGGQAVMGKIIELDTIRGSSFLTIQAALMVFQQLDTDLARYNIQVVHDNTSAVVVFAEKEGETPGAKKAAVRSGAEAKMPPAEVDLLLADPEKITVLDKIDGKNLLAVQKALEVFSQNYTPDLAHYKIEVVLDGKSIVVIFTDKDRQPGTRGSGGPHPGFEVELDGEDLHVLGWNFTR